MPVSFASENVGYWLWGCETEQSELGENVRNGTERKTHTATENNLQ